jgi:hypothetical protein
MADRAMTDTPGRRRTKLGDPTAEQTSDPIPDGEDILSRENPRRGETPRRYDEELEDDGVMPSSDSTLKTRI